MEIILSVNAGSSSLKFQMLELPSETLVVQGLIEKIGLEGSCLTYKIDGKKTEVVEEIKDHKDAVELLLKTLKGANVVDDLSLIKGVGHRVVHGGEIYSSSVVIDEKVKEDIKALSILAPLHQPVNLIGIEAFEAVLPNALQVAVFDTAFHQTMEIDDYLYPIPYEYYEKHKIRRYGFHGTSHDYVSKRTLELMHRAQAEGTNMITVHLGNGASITAIKDGKSVNTSMGFTPLAGIMMGTRCGDIDPAILPFLMEVENLSSEEVLDIFNNKSGMLGISGISSDARAINDAYDAGDERAILTRKMYAKRVSETIGQYYMQLGRVDAIAFTGGIGENAVDIRKDILKLIDLPLRLDVDYDLNTKVQGKESKISKDKSSCEVWVVPTNEELAIARDTYAFLVK